MNAGLLNSPDAYCSDCCCWHPLPRCRHDQDRPCRHCGNRVGPLSEAGPDICWRCALKLET